jgi:hypothetical protein
VSFRRVLSILGLTCGLALALVLTGCCRLVAHSDRAAPVSSSSPASASAEASSQVPNGMVRVPDVEGLSDASEVLRAAGLVPVAVAVHGPVDPDCAGAGEAYRQDPAPGVAVTRGSKVTYRYWWETQ